MKSCVVTVEGRLTGYCSCQRWACSLFNHAVNLRLAEPAMRRASKHTQHISYSTQPAKSNTANNTTQSRTTLWAVVGHSWPTIQVSHQSTIRWPSDARQPRASLDRDTLTKLSDACNLVLTYHAQSRPQATPRARVGHNCTSNNARPIKWPAPQRNKYPEHLHGPSSTANHPQEQGGP